MAKLTVGEVRSMALLIRPVAALISGLSPEARIELLANLVAQEICLLPHSERQARVALLLEDFPTVFSANEKGMQAALASNARRGV